MLTRERGDRVKRYLIGLALVIAAYLGAGFLAGALLPYLVLPYWVVRIISIVFEPVFVTIFGRW